MKTVDWLATLLWPEKVSQGWGTTDDPERGWKVNYSQTITSEGDQHLMTCDLFLCKTNGQAFGRGYKPGINSNKMLTLLET